MAKHNDTRRAKIASIHVLVILALTLIFALSSRVVSFSWFSANDRVAANGITVSANDPSSFEEINYYRGTDTHLITENGEKYNQYHFSFASSALDLMVENENGEMVKERDSFSTTIPMLEHSDLSANSQVLSRVKVSAPGTYVLRFETDTTEYLGNVISAKTANGDFDLNPSDLPLSSVVGFALLDSSMVGVDTENQEFSLTEKELQAALKSCVTLSGDTATFSAPFESIEFTVGEDCYFYIFVDYYLPAVGDILDRTFEYVEEATKVDPTYDDIVVGHTNLKFVVDFKFVIEGAE